VHNQELVWSYTVSPACARLSSPPALDNSPNSSASASCKIPLQAAKMSSNTSEDNFEWVETPPAPSPVTPEFDCGVKTTSVSSSQYIPKNPASH
jgi:hypothetical protein